MEVTYSGKIECWRCGYESIYVAEEPYKVNGDDLTMRCKRCRAEVEPGQKKPDIPKVVLEGCVDAVTLVHYKKRMVDVSTKNLSHVIDITNAVLTAAHYAELVDALRFYANEENWRMRLASYDRDRTYVTPAECDLDLGAKARTALTKAEVMV